jgi:hypothetical protein
MSFNNSSSVPIQYTNATISSNLAQLKPKNTSLNASMIDRVHNAKPGCSACGKKVY